MTRPSKREIETDLEDLGGDPDGVDLSDGWDFIDPADVVDRDPALVVDGFEHYTPGGGGD